MPPSTDLSKALLHPVRARLIMLLGEKPQTPLELRTRLPEIPLGTLYRHLNVLLDCKVIEVVRERRIHGTVERQFALQSGASYYTDQQKDELSPYDITRIVGILTSLVSQEFERFAETARPPYKDGEFSMITTTLYLTPEEIQEYRQFMKQFISKEGREPQEGLERRLIALFSVPSKD